MSNNQKQLISTRFKEVFDSLKASRKIASYEALGDAVGLKKAAISNMINGTNSVSHKVIDYLSESYGVNQQYILTGEGNMYTESTRKASVNGEIDLSRSVADLIALTKEQAEITRIQAETADKHAAARMREADNNSRLISLLESKHGIIADDAKESHLAVATKLDAILELVVDVAAGKRYHSPEQARAEYHIRLTGQPQFETE